MANLQEEAQYRQIENEAKLIKLAEEREKKAKEIKNLVDQLAKASGEEAEKLKEQVRTQKLKLEGLKKQERISKNIQDLELEIVATKDKQAMLDFDLAGFQKKMLRMKVEIKKLEKSGHTDKAKNLNQERKEMKLLFEQRKGGIAQAQATQKIQEKLLGTLGLSVGALKNMVSQAKLFGMAMLRSLGTVKLILLAMTALAAIVAKSLFDSAVKFRDELGATARQSGKLAKDFFFLNKLGVNTVAITKSLTDNFGTLEEVTKETVEDLALMEKLLGVSSDNSAKVLKNIMAISGFEKEVAMDRIQGIVALAEGNEMLANDVMADLATNTEFFAEFARDGGDNLAKAAMEAKKLGVSLSTTAKIANSLLDFESSIEKELEASLLTGKQINYNKARQLALEGDISGAAKEVVKQIGGQAEFEAMNAIQRRSLAESIGVTVEELSRLASGKPMELAQPKERTPLDIDGLKSIFDELKSEMQKLTEAINRIVPGGSATTTALGVVGGIAGIGLAGKGISKVGSKLMNKMGKKGLDPGEFGGKGFANRGKTSATTPPKSKILDQFGRPISSTPTPKGPGIFSRAFTGAKDLVSGIVGKGGKFMSGLGTVGKVGLSGAGALMKKLPILGLLTSGVFAAGRMAKGDFGGAGLELASGAASMYPGPGTAASFGIDATLLARDQLMAGTQANQTTDITRPAEVFGPPPPNSPLVRTGELQFVSQADLVKEFGDLEGGQRSTLIKAINDGTFEQYIERIIQRMPEMMAQATNKQVATETQEFIEVLKGIRENTGKTYTEIGNMIAE